MRSLNLTGNTLTNKSFNKTYNEFFSGTELKYNSF